MCVGGTKNDLGRGPELIRQIYNPRALNAAILNKIKKNHLSHGLLNRQAENAIYIGVNKEYIKGGLLGYKAGAYSNIVEWTRAATEKGATMMLYNGNHRCSHISKVFEQEFYSWHTGNAEMKKKDLTPREMADLKTSTETVHERLVKGAVWLVKFFDQSEFNLNILAYMYANESDQRPLKRRQIKICYYTN